MGTHEQLQAEGYAHAAQGLLRDPGKGWPGAVRQRGEHPAQPIVDFMARSVEEVLKAGFGRSQSDKGVHILDPFVGTGNFITRVMKKIRTSALDHVSIESDMRPFANFIADQARWSLKKAE
jgi:hypothetical protein